MNMMDPWIWFSLAPFGVIIGAGLVYIVMSARLDVLLADQRAELAAARATVESQQKSLDETVKSAEEAGRTKAMTEFLDDIRIEERHYTREHKMLFLSRKCLVRQERIFFRNIPLSNWIEHEMPIEEGADVEKLAAAVSVFTNLMLPEGGSDGGALDKIRPIVKVLRHVR